MEIDIDMDKFIHKIFVSSQPQLDMMMTHYQGVKSSKAFNTTAMIFLLRNIF